jgi:hypothetical protein
MAPSEFLSDYITNDEFPISFVHFELFKIGSSIGDDMQTSFDMSVCSILDGPDGFHSKLNTDYRDQERVVE